MNGAVETLHPSNGDAGRVEDTVPKTVMSGEDDHLPLPTDNTNGRDGYTPVDTYCHSLRSNGSLHAVGVVAVVVDGGTGC